MWRWPRINAATAFVSGHRDVELAGDRPHAVLVGWVRVLEHDLALQRVSGLDVADDVEAALLGRLRRLVGLAGLDGHLATLRVAESLHAQADLDALVLAERLVEHLHLVQRAEVARVVVGGPGAAAGLERAGGLGRSEQVGGDRRLRHRGADAGDLGTGRLGRSRQGGHEGACQGEGGQAADDTLQCVHCDPLSGSSIHGG